MGVFNNIAKQTNQAIGCYTEAIFFGIQRKV